jgi:hypothetical protein
MPQIIDCVLVSNEPYTALGRRDWSPEECRQFCMDVDLFAFHLAVRGFRARPWEQPYIERAMRSLGCKLLQWGRFLRDDDKHWSWHFWTDQGRGFAIFDQSEMIIFRVGKPEKWFRADMPEVWTRETVPELLSGAPRNEPELPPSEVPANTTMAMPGWERTRKLDLPPIWQAETGGPPGSVGA